MTIHFSLILFFMTTDDNLKTALLPGRQFRNHSAIRNSVDVYIKVPYSLENSFIVKE